MIAGLMLFGAAILIGLPPQSALPTGFGRIIVLPVLPTAQAAPDYSVAVSWHARHTPEPRAALTWDTFWTDQGAFDSTAGLPMFFAVADSATADALVRCSRDTVANPGSASPILQEVPALPSAEASLLDALDRYEFGTTRGGYRFLRVDDRETDSYPFVSCGVDASSIITKDDIELHLQAPNLTVLTPTTAIAATREDTIRPFTVLGALPSGWSAHDARALTGTRTDFEMGIYWDGAEVEGRRGGEDPGVRILSVGPVTLEASSLNASRRADRALFWSGLLVGLAGSCLLMLFEGLPWRPSARASEGAPGSGGG
ncbi:hypothetical protein [Humibacillus xanthopallidus]|uniref:hypothetical protein n=1 Tax=Humibacillus xanthopallidus TaxID=412689 RepID=UPI00384E7652